MGSILKWGGSILGLAAVVAIAAFLGLLVYRGIHISYSGDVQILGMPSEIRLRLPEPVTLTLADGATLTAAVSGVQAAPVAVSFASSVCPQCGAAMLPVRYDILSGRIEWACPHCSAVGP